MDDLGIITPDTIIALPISNVINARDYFAAAALTGIVAMTPTASEYMSRLRGSPSVTVLTAEAAYALADAMLEARKPKGGSGDGQE